MVENITVSRPDLWKLDTCSMYLWSSRSPWYNIICLPHKILHTGKLFSNSQGLIVTPKRKLKQYLYKILWGKKATCTLCSRISSVGRALDSRAGDREFFSLGSSNTHCLKITEKWRYFLCPENGKTFAWLGWPCEMAVPSPQGDV